MNNRFYTFSKLYNLIFSLTWFYCGMVSYSIPTIGAEKCSNGPYVFDSSNHREGIGMQLFWRYEGILLSNVLNIPWIGLLINYHDDPPRDNHAIDVFGLSDPNTNDCDFETLMNITTNTNDHKKWNMHGSTEIMNNISVSEMCSGKKTESEYQIQFDLDPYSIIVVDSHGSRQLNGFEYCIFNDQFRKRYHTRQEIARLTPKPNSEFWITAHFRMMDGTDEPAPIRNGYRSLQQLAKDTAVYANMFPNALIFFISEGSNEKIFANFTNIVPNVKYLLHLTWQKALWKMANSNVLLGGFSSSFFRTGVYLNIHSCLVDVKCCYERSTAPQSMVNFTRVHAKDFV